jgi:uncharacterized protein
MQVIISPAKTMKPVDACQYHLSNPLLHSDMTPVVNHFLELNTDQWAKHFKISPSLAQTARDRLDRINIGQKYPAILAFQGDVYKQIFQTAPSQQALSWAQDHIGIISSLYGYLRPLDQIALHRMEMDRTKLSSPHISLVDYWKPKVTQLLNDLIIKKDHKLVVNLASNAYSEVIDQKQLNADWINIHFRQQKEEKLNNIGIMAKRARGMMVQFIIDHRIDSAGDLLAFNHGGYSFQPELSSETDYYFVK